MCNSSVKLIAFLDRELADDEMAIVQQHVTGCWECRRQLNAYEQVSRSFDEYCDAIATTNVHGGFLSRPAVLSGAAAVAVAAAIFLFFANTRVERPPALHPALPAAPQARVTDPPPLATLQIPAVHRRHAGTRVQRHATNWVPAESAIHIAFSADSIFPPGAVPEGVNFTADLSVAADGSPRQVSLQPRLIAFQRSATQP